MTWNPTFWLKLEKSERMWQNIGKNEIQAWKMDDPIQKWLQEGELEMKRTL